MSSQCFRYMQTETPESMVHGIAHLLQDHGDTVLDGSHVLSLFTPCLRVVSRLFEQLFPRGPGIGFQALPSHPADNIPILQAQFLLDVLQKAPSLTIVHPPDCSLLFDVNIFPFKSLRYLELRCLPPHCLRGLRGVYSQLEILVCSHCVSSLEEVISLCGGDLSSALPWLELHTLDFSHNKIHSLDQSLELLNSLRVLDLSHNLLKDCGSYMKVLSELRMLNLGYNSLASVPELSVSSSAQLHTLVLQHNMLSSTSGLEHLRHLQHLDLSFNLLADPSQLAGLTPLKSLRMLFLEGNPLCFNNDYRVSAAQHLSPKVSNKVLLDGMPLSALETTTSRVFSERIVIPQSCNSATESSCTGDLTDSCSAPENAAKKRLPRKKSKVKVRRASISERSDSECEQRSRPTASVLQHQKDIERTDSFREQFGVDWLQYRPHLEDELRKDDPTNYSPVPVRRSPLFNLTLASPSIQQTSVVADSPSPETVSSSLEKPPSPEDATAEDADQLMERIEDALEDGLWRTQESSMKPEEEEDVKDALCSPVTVCPLVDGQPRDADWPWVFLRVTRQYLLEIDLQRGRVMFRRELRCLREITTTATKWDWNGEEQELPLLTLSFHSICKDDQCVSYVVLDNTKDISVTTLLDVLQPALEENLKFSAADDPGPPMLQCLKCKTEFSQQEDSGAVPGPDAERATEDEMHDNHTGNTGCPSCGSFHVILAPLHHTGETSAQQSPDGATNEKQKSFYVLEGEDEMGSSETGSISIRCQDDGDSSARSGQLTPEDKSRTATPSSKEDSEPLQDSWPLSPTSASPQQTLDFRVVDHRLKLHLDMEILCGDLEEFQCSMRVPVVSFGKPEEFLALVVVSNQKIYFLEISGESRGPPCDWLQLGGSHDLTSLTHLHVGLQEQCVYLGFESSEDAYTLLTRSRQCSTAFSQHVIDTLSHLPPRYRNALQYSPKEEVTEEHRLWHLLHDSLGAGSRPPGYFYALMYFLREDMTPGAAAEPCANADHPPQNKASPAALAQGAGPAAPMTLLVTQTHLYLLEETHQWQHVAAEEDGSRRSARKVAVREKQAISTISSVHLFSSAPLHLRIRIYNETQLKESAWLLWTEDPNLPQEIVECLRGPWEAEYYIQFNQINHESLESYLTSTRS